MLKYILASILLLSLPVMAEKKNDGDGGGKENEEKSYTQLVKDKEQIKGLFQIYKDPKNGSLMMGIDKKQLDKEFIYMLMEINMKDNLKMIDIMDMARKH